MRSGSGIRDSRSGKARCLQRGFARRPSAFRLPTSAFTLVELLVTVAIITILASMLLGAASLSMGTARQARTEALITRLHTLLSQYYDSFRHRRVELNTDTLGRVRSSNNRNALAAARLLGTREQLKMELPDRWSDLLGKPLGSSLGGAPIPASAAAAPQYLEGVPPMARMFLRRYERIRGATNRVSGGPNTVGDLVQNQGAECLYLFVMLAAGDGESAGLFKESEIGDTDGDGAPEFLDAWGNPIQFLRWAPGFESDIQLDIPELTLLEEEESVLAVVSDRDPFDLFRVDRYDPADATAADRPRGFRLAPLIYSAGSDQEYGVEDGSSFAGQQVETRQPNFTQDATLNFEEVSDPFLYVRGPPDRYLGGVVDRATATDNVHNHYFEGR